MATIAYRAHRSRRKFMQHAKVKKELGKVIDGEVKTDLLAEFDKRVKNWKKKPEFKARKIIRVNDIKVNVFPAGEHKDIWKYVSFGTVPHKIRVKNAATLAFLWGGKGSYNAKTGTGDVYGKASSVTGGTWRFPLVVDHPGTEAREFEKHIREDYKPEFSRVINNAFCI